MSAKTRLPSPKKLISKTDVTFNIQSPQLCRLLRTPLYRN